MLGFNSGSVFLPERQVDDGNILQHDGEAARTLFLQNQVTPKARLQHELQHFHIALHTQDETYQALSDQTTDVVTLVDQFGGSELSHDLLRDFVDNGWQHLLVVVCTFASSIQNKKRRNVRNPVCTAVSVVHEDE